MSSHLRLDLDALYAEGYYYTEFDQGGEGHAIVIRVEDKEAFLQAFADRWAEMAEDLLTLYDAEGEEADEDEELAYEEDLDEEDDLDDFAGEEELWDEAENEFDQ